MDNLADITRKNRAESQFENHREQAERFQEQGDHRRAAKHYAKAAEAMDRLADLEPSGKVTKESKRVASNLREAANHQKRLAENQTAGPGKSGPGSGSGSDSADTVSGGPNDASRTERDADTLAESAAAFLRDPPNLSFDDVGGMDDLKQRLISKIADPLERRELYEKYDLHPTTGVILYGPPGTGKTYLSKALAGRLGWNFIRITPSDITSSLVGEAADNVKELFAVAREHAPCLIFIDEIDSIATERAGDTQATKSEEQMLTQLLLEMSELEGEDEVVVIGATNFLEKVDDALLNPDRFPEVIEIPPPDAEAREAILRVHLRHRPAVPGELDWEQIKERTNRYSASDLETVAKQAAENALNEVGPDGKIQKITQRHIDQALEEVDPSLDKMSGHHE